MLFRKRWGHFSSAVVLGLVVLVPRATAQLPFSAPKNISNNSDFTATPQTAADSSGNVFAVWEDDGKSSGNILFSRSLDGGVSFSAPVSLSNTKTFPSAPRIVVDSNNGINVVWNDSPSGNLDVFFSRSVDGGATFSSPVNVSHSSPSNAPGNPQLATDSTGNIFVAWEDDGVLGILFARSADGGVTFSSPMTVSTNTTGSFMPELTLGPTGNIYLVWEDDTSSNAAISFARSLDHGQTFAAPKTLSSGNGRCTNPQINSDLSGNLNVVWENDSPGNFEIFFSRSTDAGLNFSAPLNVSNRSGSSTAPMVASDSSGGINVIWLDSTPPATNTDVFFSRSSNGGTTFSAPQNLSSTMFFSSNPSFSIDLAGNINVVFQHSSSGPNDVFFVRSTDSGVTFSAPQNLSNDSGDSSAAQIVADKNGSLNVIWSDATPGPHQVFFSRFTAAVVNHPPVANAGADQSIQATSQNGTNVTLDGSKSSDPDNDTLTYAWTDQSNNPVGSTAVVQLNLLPGSYTFTLTVTDPGNLSNSATVHLTITAPVNHPPVANAGASQTLGCTSRNGAPVTLNGSASSDPDGDTLNFVWKDAATGNIVGTAANVSLSVPLGPHSFTLTVTDPGGLSSSASVLVTVQDTTSPTLSVALSPNTLQPPNHQLIPVTATITASDACSSSVSVKLVSIVSSDSDSALGNGDQPNDIQSASGGAISFGADVRSFQLRAETAGPGASRTYTVTYSATDASGNPVSAAALVTVPMQGNSGGNHDHDGDNDRNHHKKKKHHDKDHDGDKDHDDDGDHNHH